MANYRFPTSTTEGENNFVQFDIYKLEPVITEDASGSNVDKALGTPAATDHMVDVDQNDSDALAAAHLSLIHI